MDETFTFDADGNQTSDSLWTNSWDGENRLIVTESANGVPSGGKAKETWTLDAQSRWVQRIIYSWNGSTYVPQSTNHYVWEGKMLLAILDHTNGLVMSFLRGLDLSGSLEGAGGGGGVLAVNIVTNGTHFFAYDGNGNVIALASGASGVVTARYDYDPFARPLRETGPGAAANPLRFSTQLADTVTGRLKYLYRDNEPPKGRWLSCDPIGENGGLNSYAFLQNAQVNVIDAFGLCRVVSSGFRYRVSVSALDATVQNNEYSALRDQIVQNSLATVAGWGFNNITPNPPTLNSSGPFALWSDLQSPRYSLVAAFFFFYADWEIDESAGRCGLNIDEDIDRVRDGNPFPRKTDRFDWGTPEFGGVVFRKAAKRQPIGNCTTTMIFADAPGIYTWRNSIMTLTVSQRLKVIDIDHGNAVVQTRSHTVSVSIDGRNNGLPTMTFNP